MKDEQASASSFSPHPSSLRLIAGCMSGTSADGVDCAIVEVEGRGLDMKARPLSHAYEPFSAGLRKQILDVRQKGEVRFADLAEIGRQVTLAHVPAFQKACKAANVAVLGREKLGGGFITVVISGDVAAVEAAVAAGKAKVEGLGKLIAAHIIARPSEGVVGLLPKG